MPDRIGNRRGNGAKHQKQRSGNNGNQKSGGSPYAPSRPDAYYAYVYASWRRHQRREADRRGYLAGEAARAADADYYRVAYERGHQALAREMERTGEHVRALRSGAYFGQTYWLCRDRAGRLWSAWRDRVPYRFRRLADAALVIGVVVLLSIVAVQSGLFRNAGRVPQSMIEAKDSPYNRALEKEMIREEEQLKAHLAAQGVLHVPRRDQRRAP